MNQIHIRLSTYFLIITCGLLSLVPHTSFAADSYKLLAPLPGGKTELPVGDAAGEAAASYFTSLYNFAITVVGIAALLMIVVGGFWYITSAGNQARMGTAKTVMWDAILGLSVALLAWIILNTINPQLVGGNISRLVGAEYVLPEDPEDPEPENCPAGQFIVCDPTGTSCGCSDGSGGG